MGKGAKGKHGKSDKKLDKKARKASRKASSTAAAEEVEKQARQDEAIAEHEAEAVKEIKDVANSLRVGKGFVLADVRHLGDSGLHGRQDRRQGGARRRARPSWPTCRSGSSPSPRSARKRSVLLVVQGMDTSGKGGIVRHVVGQSTRRACKVHRVQGADRRRSAHHDFLWRIRERPARRPASSGVFDRSHYEDVLIVRVHELVPEATWSRRYAQINDFEAQGRRRGHDHRQGDAAHLQRTSRRRG